MGLEESIKNKGDIKSNNEISILKNTKDYEKEEKLWEEWSEYELDWFNQNKKSDTRGGLFFLFLPYENI